MATTQTAKPAPGRTTDLHTRDIERYQRLREIESKRETLEHTLEKGQGLRRTISENLKIQEAKLQSAEEFLSKLEVEKKQVLAKLEIIQAQEKVQEIQTTQLDSEQAVALLQLNQLRERETQKRNLLQKVQDGIQATVIQRKLQDIDLRRSLLDNQRNQTASQKLNLTQRESEIAKLQGQIEIEKPLHQLCRDNNAALLLQSDAELKTVEEKLHELNRESQMVLERPAAWEQRYSPVAQLDRKEAELSKIEGLLENQRTYYPEHRAEAIAKNELRVANLKEEIRDLQAKLDPKELQQRREAKQAAFEQEFELAVGELPTVSPNKQAVIGTVVTNARQSGATQTPANCQLGEVTAQDLARQRTEFEAQKALREQRMAEENQRAAQRTPHISTNPCALHEIPDPNEGASLRV